MAVIIDLEEERRKRRKTLTNCCLCQKVLLASEVHMVGDDAELFLMCDSCEKELLKKEVQECPECGREVFFLYKTEHFKEACAICVNDAMKRSGETSMKPSTPF